MLGPLNVPGDVRQPEKHEARNRVASRNAAAQVPNSVKYGAQETMASKRTTTTNPRRGGAAVAVLTVVVRARRQAASDK